MIAILNRSYYMNGCDNIKDFLIAYVEYIGCNDTKAFRILANSDEMSVEELVSYINNNCYDYDDRIVEIYTLNKKLY